MKIKRETLKILLVPAFLTLLLPLYVYMAVSKTELISASPTTTKPPIASVPSTPTEIPTPPILATELMPQLTVYVPVSDNQTIERFNLTTNTVYFTAGIIEDYLGNRYQAISWNKEQDETITADLEIVVSNTLYGLQIKMDQALTIHTQGGLDTILDTRLEETEPGKVKLVHTLTLVFDE